MDVVRRRVRSVESSSVQFSGGSRSAILPLAIDTLEIGCKGFDDEGHEDYLHATSN